MKKEYLPIGSVCTLYKNNIKVMIVGYFSMEYDNDMNAFMYAAVPYPKGTLASKNRYSFNDADIKKVDFIGFKNEEYDKFISKLSTVNIDNIEGIFNGLAEDSDKLLKRAMNFEFDENGFVIVENNRKDTDTLENPFNSYKNNSEVVEKQSEPEDASNWNIFKKYKFDDKGTVIGVEEENSQIEETANNASVYKFDENGIVIDADEEDSKSGEEKGNAGPYKFDDNGFVVGADGEEKKSAKSFKFNGKGFVIDTNEEERLTTGPYKFDENGFVVAVNKEE